MHVLGIIDDGATGDRIDRVVDTLVEHLSRSGRVGVVRYDATIADGITDVRDATITPGGAVTYALGADGDWTATGTDLTVTDALNALAPTCAYAIVTGIDRHQSAHPAIVVGSTEAPETDGEHILAAVEQARDLDVAAVQRALEATDPYETLESLVAQIKRRETADRAGAIATFTGRVRAKDSDNDVRTELLEFEKYEGVAEQRMAALQADLEARDGVFGVELYHRTGVIADGEDIVHVVVLAGHREEAFRTVEDGINRLKDEVPLFKKEVTVEETFWVHER